jgi:hypothetical protein
MTLARRSTTTTSWLARRGSAGWSASCSLHSVVLTAVDPVAVPWSGADWCLFLPSCQLRINPSPGAKPDVRVTYDPTTTDDTLCASALPPKPVPPVEPASAEVFFGGVFGAESLRDSHVLKSSVQSDFATEAASAAFDLAFEPVRRFNLPQLPCLPREWNVGLLLGTSGSGKSFILRRLAHTRGLLVSAASFLRDDGRPVRGAWARDEPALASLGTESTALLGSFGGGALSAAAARPFELLSRGERQLVAMARVVGGRGRIPPGGARARFRCDR